MLLPIKETQFNFSDFLSELNQKELVFFLFLSTQKNANDIRDILHKYDNIEQFIQIATKSERKIIQNLPSDEIRGIIFSLYEKTDNSMIYRVLQAKEQESLFSVSNHLYALYCFINVLFKMKYFQAEKNRNEFDYLSGMDEWIKKEVTFFEKRFLIPNKPHTNILGLIVFMGHTDLYLQEDMDADDDVDMFYTRVSVMTYCLGQQNALIDKARMAQLKAENRKLETKQNKNEKEIEKKKAQMERISEQQKMLITELNDLKKQEKGHASTNQSVNEESSFHHTFYQMLQKKDEEIEQYRVQLDVAKHTPNPIYENMIEKLNEQLYAVKEDAKEKKTEMKQLTKKLAEYERESFASFMERYLKKNEMNAELFSLLKRTVTKYEADFGEKEIADVANQTETNEQKNRIGYAVLESGVFYVCFSDKTKMEIKEIPSYIYIGQNQFVLVSYDGVFRWLFNSLYQKEYDYMSQTFVSVNRKEEEVYFLDGNDRKCQVRNIPSVHHLKSNQVISIGSHGEFQRYYPTAFVNADIHMDAIKAKGQEAYYVLDIHENGCLLRHIETGKEIFQTLTSELDFAPRQIVCLEGQHVMHVFNHSQFYTLSSYYHNKYEHGIAYLEEDVWMVKKLSGETSIIRNLPFRIDFEEGDAITVDEHNQFLRKVQTERTTTETIESKKMAALSLKPEKDKKTVESEVFKRVLIVGKITYEESYRTAFRKKGYQTEMVDGYISWSRVKAKAKNQDIIVVVTNFVSHENMWKIKEEINDIPIIYSEVDGANQIAERLNA